jgi:hypothetical protein
VNVLTRLKDNTSRTIILSALIILLIIIAVSLTLVGEEKSLPSSITKEVGYSLYYPVPPPSGYALEKKSLKVDRQIVFFTLSNNAKKIFITEQAKPKNPPDFKKLQQGYPNLKRIDTLAGEGIYGLVREIPIGIVLTNTTLISINGSANTPVDVVARTAQNMSSL